LRGFLSPRCLSIFRQFVDDIDSEVKDIIDKRRAQQELELTGKVEPKRNFDTRFEGHGVLIVAKETVGDPMPLCMGLGERGNEVRIHLCVSDYSDVTN
jgi:hypothetical protein